MVRVSWDKKLEVWGYLARGQPISKIPPVARVSEYQVRLLKREWESLPVERLALLPKDLRINHPRYLEFIAQPEEPAPSKPEVPPAGAVAAELDLWRRKDELTQLVQGLAKTLEEADRGFRLSDFDLSGWDRERGRLAKELLEFALVYIDKVRKQRELDELRKLVDAFDQELADLFREYHGRVKARSPEQEERELACYARIGVSRIFKDLQVWVTPSCAVPLGLRPESCWSGKRACPIREAGQADAPLPEWKV